MLPRQYGRRRKDCRLFARQHAFHHRPQRDLGLAEADVAAQQPVHRAVGFHIPFDFLHAAQLVVGLLIGERLLEFTLPVVVRREGVALLPLALSVQMDESRRQVLGRRLGAGARLCPVGAAQLGQAHLFMVAADIFRD